MSNRLPEQNFFPSSSNRRDFLRALVGGTIGAAVYFLLRGKKEEPEVEPKKPEPAPEPVEDKESKQKGDEGPTRLEDVS